MRSRSKSKRKNLKDSGKNFKKKLEKTMKKEGFKLERSGKHFIWVDEDNNKITTSKTPTRSQKENVIRQVKRDIKKTKKSK